MYGTMPKFREHVFGEVGIINEQKKPVLFNKNKDHDLPSMHLGLAPDHTSYTYHFLMLNMMMIQTSRDVIWLNKMYGEYKKLKNVHSVH